MTELPPKLQCALDIRNPLVCIFSKKDQNRGQKCKFELLQAAPQRQCFLRNCIQAKRRCTCPKRTRLSPIPTRGALSTFTQIPEHCKTGPFFCRFFLPRLSLCLSWLPFPRAYSLPMLSVAQTLTSRLRESPFESLTLTLTLSAIPTPVGTSPRLSPSFSPPAKPPPTLASLPRRTS